WSPHVGFRTKAEWVGWAISPVFLGLRKWSMTVGLYSSNGIGLSRQFFRGDRLPTGKAVLEVMVVLDGLLPALPAKEDQAVLDDAVEVDQSLLDALDDGLELGEAFGGGVEVLLRLLDLLH